MPVITHSQSTRHNNGPYPPGNSQTVKVPDPVITSAKVQKTRVDSDGWRPMTNWSKATAYSGIPAGSVGIYGLGEVVLHYKDKKRQFDVRNINTKFYVRALPKGNWPSEANVKNAALSKLKGQQLNVVMLLKDRNETLRGLHNRLVVLTKSVRYARKGQLVRSATQLRKWWRSRTPGVVNRYKAANDKIGKPLASMWLELNFLHMQVISDANGAIAELSREVPVGFVHGRSGLATESTHTVSVVASSWNHCGTIEATIKRENIVYAQVSALPDLDWLTSASRLGITNPLYVLWDSIPLSFVLDWVIPVGQYLNGFDATLGMKFKGAHVGFLEKLTVLKTETKPPNGYTLTGAYNVEVLCPKSFKRVLTDQFPDLPKLRNPLSGLAWKAATAASLLAVAVGQSQQKPR